MSKHQSEEVFLATYDDSTYEKPSVAVDCVVFRYYEGKLQLLLVKRTNHPFKGKFALPGGFLTRYSSLEDMAVAKVYDKTGITLSQTCVEQLVTIGNPNRDPRGWIISVAYLCFLPYHCDDIELNEGASWVDVALDEKSGQVVFTGIDGALAFDHNVIVQTAFTRIQGRFSYRPTVYNILPEYNRLAVYNQLYFQFTGDKLPQTTFNRKFKRFFVETDKSEQTKTRFAKLYRLSDEIDRRC